MKRTNYSKVFFGLFTMSVSIFSLAKIDSEGNNGLMRAARQGDVDKVSELLVTKYNGEIINQQNNNGNTALMLAVMSRSAPTVKKILSYNIVDISLKNNDGKTALDLALELSGLDSKGKIGKNKMVKDEIVELLKGHKQAGVDLRSGNGMRKPAYRIPYSIWK